MLCWKSTRITWLQLKEQEESIRKKILRTNTPNSVNSDWSDVNNRCRVQIDLFFYIPELTAPTICLPPSCCTSRTMNCCRGTGSTLNTSTSLRIIEAQVIPHLAPPGINCLYWFSFYRFRIKKLLLISALNSRNGGRMHRTQVNIKFCYTYKKTKL